MAALNFPNSGLTVGDQYTGDNGTTYTWDGVKWVGRAAGGAAGTNSIQNGTHTVQVDADGNLILPVGSIIKDVEGTQYGGSGDGSSITLTGTIPFVTNVLSTVVNFNRPSNTPNTVDVIDTGLTIKRANNGGGIYNSASNVETSWNQNQSPLGTQWNADGWSDLTDVMTRTYTTFYHACDGAVGSNVVHKEFVMHDTINDKYYKVKFHFWQPAGGGGVDDKAGLSYTRTLLDLTNTVYFVHPAGDPAVGVDDIGPGLSITRDVIRGIYNPQEDSAWDADYTPYGTLWNDDGWDDFTDITTRKWSSFYSSVHGQLGNHVVGRELLMHDTINNEYYTFKFTDWGEDNGGSFAYIRRKIHPTGTKLGITFADGSKQLTANTLGNLKVVDGNVIYNAAQPGHGAEIRSDVKNNYSFNTYYWTEDANWVTNNNGGLVEFNITQPWQQEFSDFLNNLDRWQSVTVSINNGPAQTLTDWWSGGFTTQYPPTTDPTLISYLRFDVVYRSRMYMGGEDNAGFFLNKYNENFRAEAQNITLEAGESQYRTGNIYATAWNYLEIRNNNSEAPVTIVTDGNNTGKTWYFGANGKLQLPVGGDIVASDGVTSVLGGGGSTGNFTFNADTITNNNGLKLSTDRGTLAIGTNMEVPGVAGHFHIAFDSSNTSPNASDLFFGDDYNYVKLPGYELTPATPYGVEIGANNRNGGSSHNWRFGTDGGLTIPGEIKTASGTGDVVIEANDGTARTWTFGRDGSIKFPTQSILDYRNQTNYTTGPTLQLADNSTDATVVITGPAATAENQYAKRLVIQGQPGWRGTATQATGAEGGDVYIWAGYGGEGTDQTGDGGDAKLRGGNGGASGGYVRLESGSALSANGQGGFLDLNAGDALNGTVSYDTAQGGNVEIRGGRGYGHGGVVNIHTASTDNWNHQWTFDGNGILTMPGYILSNHPAGHIQLKSNGPNSFTRLEWMIPDNAEPLAFPNNGRATYLDVQNDGVTISNYVSGASGLAWKFDTNGTLTFPNASTFNGNDFVAKENEELNLTIVDSSAYIGVKENNNNLNDPAAYMDVYYGKKSRIRTASLDNQTEYDWIFSPDGRTTFPAATVPAHSYGAVGDKQGMVAFDGSYIYYCIADFVGDTIVGQTGVAEDNFQYGYTYGFNKIATDITGWTLTVPGQSTSVTVTGVDQNYNAGNQTGLTFSATVTYTSTSTFTFTAPSSTNIWKRIAWSGATW